MSALSPWLELTKPLNLPHRKMLISNFNLFRWKQNCGPPILKFYRTIRCICSIFGDLFHTINLPPSFTREWGPVWLKGTNFISVKNWTSIQMRGRHDGQATISLGFCPFSWQTERLNAFAPWRTNRRELILVPDPRMERNKFQSLRVHQYRPDLAIVRLEPKM